MENPIDSLRKSLDFNNEIYEIIKEIIKTKPLTNEAKKEIVEKLLNLPKILATSNNEDSLLSFKKKAAPMT